MAEFFLSAPGEVAAFEMQATLGRVAVPAEIKDPPFPRYRPGPVIFGSLEWAQKTNQQFAHSLDGSVYVYVFGDQMGSVEMSGIAFDGLCKQSSAGGGLWEVLNYYENNRASKRELPIGVEVAGKIVQGFLTSATVTAVGLATNPAPVLNQYSLGISALP